MDQKPIRNCQLRFEFKCPMQWDALQQTAEAGVRLCGECHKQVYFCQSTEEAAAHARAGHCVAVPVGLVSPNAPSIRLQGVEIDLKLFQLVPWEVASRYNVVPVRRVGPLLTLAMSEPNHAEAIDDVTFVSGYTLEVVRAPKQDIQEALARAHRELFRTVELGALCCEEPEPDLFDGQVGRILRLAMVDGHQRKAAQVQIDITDASIVVRYGLEGDRRDFLSASATLRDELVRQLRHAASAIPGQEGQVHVQSQGQRISYQVSFNPTALGQEVILQPLS